MCHIQGWAGVYIFKMATAKPTTTAQARKPSKRTATYSSGPKMKLQYAHIVPPKSMMADPATDKSDATPG